MNIERIIVYIECIIVFDIERNTSHIIKRTGKIVKVDRNNAFTRLKLDTEGVKI